MTRLEHHYPAEPTGQPGSINSGRPRIRIIDGCPYVLVARVDGKYHEDRPHFQREDGRLWALVADVERLSAGNSL
jgi:hypothetical protein